MLATIALKVCYNFPGVLATYRNAYSYVIMLHASTTGSYVL